LIVFEKWTVTKNLTDPDTDADAGVTTIARLFFFEKSSKKLLDFVPCQVTPIIILHCLYKKYV
jgi:hypothetical protein